MKREENRFETVLTAQAVDACAEHVREFLADYKLSARDIRRYSMSVEEILLGTLESGNEGAKVCVEIGARLFRPQLTVSIACPPKNVCTPEEEAGVLHDTILKNIGLSPDYSYKREKNVYRFRVRKKKMNPLFKVLIALASALVIGMLGVLISKTVCVNLQEQILSPIYDTFLNMLGCIAGPMVFLSVAWGIYGIGDAATLKRIGKKMLLGNVVTVYFIIVAFTLLSLPLFRMDFSGIGAVGGELSSVFTMLLGIIPKNIFSPFVDGNTLQVIFLAVVIGIAMLFLGQKTNAVAKAVEQINYIVQFLVEFISELVPFVIFIVVLKMVWSNTGDVLLSTGKLFLIFIPAIVLMLIIYLLFTAARNKVSPLLLAKKGLATLLIALTTASSSAAFGTNTETCREKLGIDKKLVSFGVPLGMVTFKPSTAISYVVMPLAFAEIYSVPVSASWLVLLIITAGILSLATPPIPGGALASYTVLFSMLGIPPQGLAVALACDAIVDFVATGGDQFILQFALLNQAKNLGMVDEKILKDKR